MNRRKFIADMSLLLGATSLSGCAFLPQRKIAGQLQTRKKLAFCTTKVVGQDPFLQAIGLTEQASAQTQLVLLDPLSFELQAFPLEISSPHSIIQNPLNKDQLVIASKDRNLSLVFSLSQKKNIQTLTLQKPEYFYGHGFFTTDGRLFLSGYTQGSAGFLREYDQNFKAIGNLATHGWAPHDAALIEGGRTALVANNGWSELDVVNKPFPTSMCYIDLKTGALVDKVELPLGYRVFQHFVCNDRGDFVVGCDYVGDPDKTHLRKTSLVAYRKRNEPLRFLEASEKTYTRIQGNILSLAWDEEKQIVATTTPQGPVVIWDLKTMKATQRILENEHPHGVAVKDGDLWVTTANEGLWKTVLKTQVDITEMKQIQKSPFRNILAHTSWVDV